MKRFFALTTVSLLVCIFAAAATDELSQQAAAAYSANDWTKAKDLYSRLTTQQPDSGFAWQRLGDSQRRLRNFREAVAAFEKARQLGFQPMFTLARISAVRAEMGDHTKAIEAVEEIAKQQAPFGAMFDGEPAYGALAGNARFEAAKRKILVATHPCKFPDVNPENRQFDFWVGEWDVFNPQGVQAGTSRIERILADCVILENWTDRFGSQGKSFNKYNTQTKNWEQFWVDEQASTTYFHGQLEGKNMVFHSDAPQPDGKPGERRLTFFNLGPDQVRQFSQLTTDGGKTWTTEYDLTYVRRAAVNTANASH